jgi:hypothetical protein
MFGGNGIERGTDLRSFIGGQYSGGDERGCVGFAGSDFVGKEAPVKDYGALPLFELAIERLAKTAGPHFYGLLLVGHLSRSNHSEIY